MQAHPPWITQAELETQLSSFELRESDDTPSLLRFAGWVERYARVPGDPLAAFEPRLGLSLRLRLWGQIQTLMLALQATPDPRARAAHRRLWPRLLELSEVPVVVRHSSGARR